MNKSLVLVLVVLAVIAFGVWFFTNGPSSPDSSTASSTAQSPTTTSAAPAGGKATTAKTATKGIPNSTTYKSLLTQTGSYECDYSGVTASGQTSNVIYIYGGKMRGEFRTTSSGNTSANLFVYDGRYMYQWKEGSSEGTRTVLTSLSQLPLIIPRDLTSGSIIGNSYTSVGWQCHTWLTNKSLLTPPSYVTFS
jgi:hypothetical protein